MNRHEYTEMVLALRKLHNDSSNRDTWKWITGGTAFGNTYRWQRSHYEGERLQTSITECIYELGPTSTPIVFCGDGPPRTMEYNSSLGDKVYLYMTYTWDSPVDIFWFPTVNEAYTFQHITRVDVCEFGVPLSSGTPIIEAD